MERSATPEYEDYVKTAKQYDRVRHAAGAELLLDLVAGQFRNRKQLKDLTLLDAGCGTGNYTYVFCREFGKVVGVEFNEGMLAQAKEKLKKHLNIVLKQGSLLHTLPLDDCSVEAVLCNQVIHHLDDPDSHEGVRHGIKELFRVLKPGGCVIINNSDPSQCDTFWWKIACPEAMARFKKERAVPNSNVRQYLKDAGFRAIRSIVPCEEILAQRKVYEDPEGPFDSEWRDGDSTFALATPEEIENGLKKLREMIDAGKWNEYYSQIRELQMKVGQFTFIIGTKLP